MKFKNALALLTLVLPQILVGSEDISGFGSPVPSRSTSPSRFGIHSPLAPASPTKKSAAGAAAHTSASAAAHNDLSTDGASVSLTLPKPQNGGAQNAAASLSTDSAPAQQKKLDALSTDDAFSTDDFDDLSARTTDFVALSEQHVVISTAVSTSKVASQAPGAAAAPQAVLASALASQQKTLSLASGSAGAAQVTVHALDSAPQKAGASSAALAPKKPNMVTRKVRFGRPQFGDSSMCQFELSATYDANEEPTLTTRANKIPASLWKAMHEAIKLKNLQCVQRDPSVSQDASYPCFCTYRKPCHITADENMRPEVLEVFVYDAAPAPANAAAALQTAAVGAAVVAASEQQKDLKEKAALAHKWVRKMARVQRKGELHTFEMPVAFDENDPQKITTNAQAKIAASLWADVKYNLSIRNRVKCSNALCMGACDRKVEAEDCDVTVHDLAPKVVPVRISIGHSEGQGECVHTVWQNAGDFYYDLNTTHLVKIGSVISNSARFSFNAIPRCIFNHLKPHDLYSEGAQQRAASSLFIHIQDLQPEAATAVTYPQGHRWTRISFKAPTIKCKKNNNAPCVFVIDPHTGLNTTDKQTQNKIAKELALEAIKKGDTKCFYCQDTSSQLAHFIDELSVDIFFPKDWGSA